jgi:hypothetical protein
MVLVPLALEIGWQVDVLPSAAASSFQCFDAVSRFAFCTSEVDDSSYIYAIFITKC